MSTPAGWAARGPGHGQRHRRLLVTLLAVPAILVGLLGMHFLAGSDEVSPAGMAMSTSAHTSAASRSAGQQAADCGLACVTSSGMNMSMTCVLALLVLIVILAVLVALVRRDPELPRRVVSLWLARVASLPPPVPPSLHVLSISRI